MMTMKKTVLNAAMAGVIGAAGMAIPTAASAVLTDGTWALTINITPATVTYKYPDSCSAAGGAGSFCTTETTYNVGSEKKGWETSFTFGQTPGTASVPAINNGTNVVVSNDFSGSYPGLGPGTYGTADATQTDFGRLVFDVAGGAISTGASGSFQVDTFFATAGGNFAQFINGTTGFGGSIDSGGNMVLSIDNRFGAIDGPTGGVVGPWNIEPGGSAPLTFTTGSMPDTASSGTISGSACTAAGTGFDCVLVSYGSVGSAWGTFTGNPYYEVWNVTLESVPSAIPVPAAVWLFGSGLLGLVGVARRKKTG